MGDYIHSNWRRTSSSGRCSSGPPIAIPGSPQARTRGGCTGSCAGQPGLRVAGRSRARCQPAAPVWLLPTRQARVHPDDRASYTASATAPANCLRWAPLFSEVTRKRGSQHLREGLSTRLRLLLGSLPDRVADPERVQLQCSLRLIRHSVRVDRPWSQDGQGHRREPTATTGCRRAPRTIQRRGSRKVHVVTRRPAQTRRRRRTRSGDSE